MLKFIALCSFVAVSSAGLLPNPHAAVAIAAAPHAYEEHHSPAQYDFSYSVHDQHTGDIKQQQESRQGDTVQGSYSLVEPDGNRRIVHYAADPHNGFNAVVQREASVHPQPHAIAHVAQPVAVAHAQPIAVSHAQPIAVSHAQPIALSHSQPIALSHSQPIAVAHAAPAHLGLQHLSHIGQPLGHLGLAQTSINHLGLPQSAHLGLAQSSHLGLAHTQPLLGHAQPLLAHEGLVSAHNAVPLGLANGVTSLSTVTHHGVHGGYHH